MTKTQTFSPGTYYYWTCVQRNSQWNTPNSYQSFTVTAPKPTPPAGTAMPVGDLPGWKQTFSDDFTAPLASGAFPGPYASKWVSYNNFYDTSHAGWYDQSIISAHDGNLDINLHTANGKALGAAPVPLVNGQWGGQVYGRFSVRMKSDSLSGYGAGFLLWNDSGNWNDGEIDFPESDLSETVKGYNHCVGNASVNCLAFDTGVLYTSWHTYTIDWTPASVKYEIDGVVVATDTANVPSKSLHWVMQVATRGSTPDPSLNGHLLIDWATIYSYAP